MSGQESGPSVPGVGPVKPANRARFFLAALFLGALAVRVAMVFFISNFDTVSGYENEEIALHLAAGEGYSMARFGPVEPTAFIYPLYTFFLAGHFLLFGHRWLPVEISQAIIGAGGTILIFLIGVRLFDRASAWLASIIYTVYPVYVYWVTQGQSLTIDIFLLMALVLCWHRSMMKGSLGGAIFSGAILGLCTLSKTLYLAFFPGFFLWTRYGRGLSWAKAARFSGLALTAALIVVSPWTLRNAVAFNRFVFVTDNTGFNLWLGNNPRASGGLYTPDKVHLASTIPPRLLAEVESAPDSPSRDDVFMEASIKHILENPGSFFALIPGRLRALWYFDPYMPSRFGAFRSGCYLMLVPFSVIGMILSRKRIGEHSLFYLLYLVLTIIYSVFFGQARFRFALEWSMILFAAHAISRILQPLGFFRPGYEPLKKMLNERGGT